MQQKVKFVLADELKAAEAGLASTMLKSASNVVMSFDKQWQAKDGNFRTKGGKGTLGAFCTINSCEGCWINLSAVIKWLSQQTNSFGLLVKENGEDFFVFDPARNFIVDGDKDGNIKSLRAS